MCCSFDRQQNTVQSDTTKSPKHARAMAFFWGIVSVVFLAVTIHFLFFKNGPANDTKCKVVSASASALEVAVTFIFLWF
jgi:hypothetical protein